MRKWQMQDAKARFAEVVRRANSEGPQVVTYRGADTAVLVSVRDYQRLNASRPDFAEFLIGGSKWSDNTIAQIGGRARDTGRDIAL